jgi:hypothetical protein
MMKIWTLPVSKEFQPDHQNFISSPQQAAGGVEQDFLWWLRRSEHVADDPNEVDWDYLPLFWNRLYINGNWGQDRLDDIQAEILRLVSRKRPTFTICEYDIISMQPFYDLCGMKVFVASRKEQNAAIDIPLLCSPYQATPPHDTRRWLASFAGNLHTHSPRPEMGEALAGRNDCHVEHADKGTDYFINLMLDSYLALCPRGYGGQSFRFYEAMQLGICPLLIGDIDTRPFKRWLPWDKVSLYLDDVKVLPHFLDWFDRKELVDMGRRAKDMYEHCLQFGQWPRYVLKELDSV